MHSQKMPPTISIATDKAVPAGGAIANTVICWPHNVMVVCPPQNIFFARAASHGSKISSTLGPDHLGKLVSSWKHGSWAGCV